MKRLLLSKLRFFFHNKTLQPKFGTFRLMERHYDLFVIILGWFSVRWKSQEEASEWSLSKLLFSNVGLRTFVHILCWTKSGISLSIPGPCADTSGLPKILAEKGQFVFGISVIEAPKSSSYFCKLILQLKKVRLPNFFWVCEKNGIVLFGLDFEKKWHQYLKTYFPAKLFWDPDLKKARKSHFLIKVLFPKLPCLQKILTFSCFHQPLLPRARMTGLCPV